MDRLALDDGETLQTLCEIDPGNEHTRLNDAVCDDQGRLWVGTYSTQGRARGRALRRDPRGEARAVLTGLIASNGVGWSPDGSVLYATDTGRSRIDRFTLGEDGSELLPDGTLMTAAEGTGDPTGWPWTPRARLDGDVGRRRRSGATRPTATSSPRSRCRSPTPPALCFGGADLATLFVTTSRLHLAEDADEPLAGAVLAFEPGVHGVPVRRFGAPEGLARRA